MKGDETTGKDSDDGTQAVSMTTFAPPSENMGGDQVYHFNMHLYFHKQSVNCICYLYKMHVYFVQN